MKYFIAALMLVIFLITTVFCLKLNRSVKQINVSNTPNTENKPEKKNKSIFKIQPKDDTEKRARALAKAASRYNGKQALGYISTYSRNEEEMYRALEILTGKDRNDEESLYKKQQQTAQPDAHTDNLSQSKQEITNHQQTMIVGQTPNTEEKTIKNDTVPSSGQSDDTNYPDDSVISDLSLAVIQANNQQVSELIKQGADVNQRDKTGYTPLMYAVIYGHTDIVKQLLAAKADVNATLPLPSQSGNASHLSILQIARTNNHTDIVNLLLSAGAKD